MPPAWSGNPPWRGHDALPSAVVIEVMDEEIDRVIAHHADREHMVGRERPTLQRIDEYRILGDHAIVACCDVPGRTVDIGQVMGRDGGLRCSRARRSE